MRSNFQDVWLCAKDQKGTPSISTVINQMQVNDFVDSPSVYLRDLTTMTTYLASHDISSHYLAERMSVV